MSSVSPVPDPQRPLAPYLVAKNCDKAIAFYKAAFGATEDFRLVEPSGKVGHAELRIQGALVMLADEYPDFGALSPASVGGCPVKFLLYVDDADKAVARAVAAGATIVRQLRNEFYGDRVATIADPFGYSWQIASRVEDISPAEMQARWDRMMKQPT
jgi:PhnB protein